METLRTETRASRGNTSICYKIYEVTNTENKDIPDKYYKVECLINWDCVYSTTLFTFNEAQFFWQWFFRWVEYMRFKLLDTINNIY